MKAIFMIALWLGLAGAASAQPQIRFEAMSYNLGRIKLGTTATLFIPFQNTGNSPLLITNASSSGTPIVVHPMEPIAAGRSGQLEFRVPATRISLYYYPVFVQTNVDNKQIQLDISFVVYDDPRRLVSGIVSDADGPLPFATVSVNNDIQRCTNTAIDGSYSLMVSPNEFLVFRSAGMKDKIAKSDATQIDVTLEEGQQLMDAMPYPPPKTIDRNGLIAAKPVTAKDIVRQESPRSRFKRDLKYTKFLLYITPTPPLRAVDSLFVQQYPILYNSLQDKDIDYQKKYNRLVFRYLLKTFGKSWLAQVRKDAIGLQDFLR